MHSFVALDVETANRNYASICAFGAARFEHGQVVERVYQLVDPEEKFEPRNIKVHGIHPGDVAGQPTFAQIAPTLERWVCGDLVVHHGHFDRSAVHQASALWQVPPPRWDWLDSSQVVRRAWPEYSRRGYGLKNVAARIGFEFEHHNPLEDAIAAGEVLLAAAAIIGVSNLGSLDYALRRSPTPAASYQLGLLADDDQRLHNQLVVFSRRSRIPHERPDVIDSARRQGREIGQRSSKRTTLIVCGDDEVRTPPPRSLLAQIVSDTEFIALVERAGN